MHDPQRTGCVVPRPKSTEVHEVGEDARCRAEAQLPHRTAGEISRDCRHRIQRQQITTEPATLVLALERPHHVGPVQGRHECWCSAAEPGAQGRGAGREGQGVVDVEDVQP